MSDKPNCYECKHRRTIPGNAHSRCEHPNIPTFGAMANMAALFGGGPPLKVTGMKVVGDQHGIRMGWFMWPLNFDPTWLKECDGFEAKEKPVTEAR